MCVRGSGRAEECWSLVEWGLAIGIRETGLEGVSNTFGLMYGCVNG